MEFKYNLKLSRKNKGITIKELADAIGVKAYTISDWEKGRSEPNISNLIKLADYFNLSIDFLVGKNINSNETYNEIIELINKYQDTNLNNELNELLTDVPYKHQVKLINIIKTIKKELFNK